MANIKVCVMCSKSKPVNGLINGFYIYPNGKVFPYCKLCSRKINKISYAKKVGKNVKDIGVRLSDVVNNKKYCNCCKLYKTTDRFFICSYVKSGLQSICKSCHRAQQKIYRRIRKMEFMLAYGGKCVCCGETKLDLLTIEHIRNKGYKLIYDVPYMLASKLKKLGWPKGYTVLCYNCNMSTKDGSPCVHNKKEYTNYINNLEKYLVAYTNRDTYFLLKEKLYLIGVKHDK